MHPYAEQHSWPGPHVPNPKQSTTPGEYGAPPSMTAQSKPGESGAPDASASVYVPSLLASLVLASLRPRSPRSVSSEQPLATITIAVTSTRPLTCRAYQRGKCT